MARPFLGNAYGNTDRRTPAQLLGGADAGAGSGAIAQQQLAIPAIQAVNQMADTFSAPGRGPTLGGPAQVPTPPQLVQGQAPVLSNLPRPQVAPNPVTQFSQMLAPSYAPYVDNMGALARSLSGFSTFFEKVNRFAQERDKEADAAAQQRGLGLAQEASQIGTFQSLQELQKRLEKGVAEGRVGYEDMLRRFQAMDPRALRYAAINLQTAYIDSSMSTLKERVAQTRQLLDGRPTDSVGADDPEFQRLMTALGFPQGMAHIMPEVLASRQQQIQAVYGSALADQEKRHGQWKTRQATQSADAMIDASSAQIVEQSVPPEQVAGTITQMLDGLYAESGQTGEEYSKYLAELPRKLVEAVVLDSGGDYQKQLRALASLPLVLSMVEVGPMRADGTRPLLLDQIGGKRALLGLVQNMQEEILKGQGLQDRLESRSGAELADSHIQSVFTDDVLGNPAAIEQAQEALLRQGQEMLNRGEFTPEQALAYTERVNKYVSNVNAGYIKPVQQRNEVALWAEMAQNPEVDHTGRIMALQQEGAISYGAAKGFLQEQNSRNREENQSNYQVLRGLQQDIAARLEEQFRRGSSEGGAVLTPNEARMIQEARGAFYRAGSELIRQGRGADMTQQLGELYSNALQRSMQAAQGPQAEAGGRSAAEVAKELGGGRRGRGNAQQNQELRRRLETEPVVTADGLAEELDRVLQGQPVSDDMRQIIRRSGMKPSDLFRQQMQQHNIELDGPIYQRLQELDTSGLMSQSRPSPQNQYIGMATRLGNQIIGGLLNTVSAPAVAAPMPMGGTGGGGGGAAGPLGGTRLSQLIGNTESYGGNYGAFNRGGSNQGHTAHGSGIDPNLVNMSIREIQRRQLGRDVPKDQHLHAVGKYQIIGSTLRSLMQGNYGPTGVSMDDRFTPEVQERLAVALARNRVRGRSVDAAMRGLRQEWIGLQNVSDAELRQAVIELQGSMAWEG